MRRYVQPNQVAQVAQLVQDGTSIHADARRLSVSHHTVSRSWTLCIGASNIQVPAQTDQELTDALIQTDSPGPPTSVCRVRSRNMSGTRVVKPLQCNRRRAS
ncbi:unnamed protein product [Pleuronectes platessa]|uniref:Uncharacterized protein n=1 Tax=Pleuronectes platessa TaxID=8262 RepID=A0A9N7VHX9_PLEPL|nr:unnamed protein product [Pleuronectes platessa]